MTQNDRILAISGKAVHTKVFSTFVLMQIAAKEIANMLGGTLEGQEDVMVDKPGKIEEGGSRTLTFLSNPRYESFAYTTKSAVLIVDRNFKPTSPVAADALIRVDDVYTSLSILMEKFAAAQKVPAKISEKASVSEVVSIGNEVTIGDFTVVEDRVVIGNGTFIHPQVFVGQNVSIGSECVIYPGVRIYRDCKIGDRCIIHANAVIGGDGFGYATQPDGSFHKIPQLGNVVIEDDVEIGANTTIDRATLGSTIIRKGVKLDNLIMVAHNVEIDEHTAVAAQAGIAGSTKIGKRCRIGGQSGFAGHIKVADGTQVQAQSGVAGDVNEPNTALYGSPALNYGSFLRSYAGFKKLPDLLKKIQELEKKIRILSR